MNATTPPPDPACSPAPQAASGCAGCLRGCLIALVVAIVLILAGGIVAATAGRTYVATNLPRWETENPWLTFALDNAGLRDKIVPPPAAKKPGGRQPGQNDRTLLPADLPLPDDALQETFSIAEGQVTAYQELGDGPDQVASRLAEAMAGQGWQTAGREEGTGALRQSWTKAGRACQAEVLAPRGVTELWLRCGAAAAAK